MRITHGTFIQSCCVKEYGFPPTRTFLHLRFRPYTGKYKSEKIRILVYLSTANLPIQRSYSASLQEMQLLRGLVYANQDLITISNGQTAACLIFQIGNIVIITVITEITIVSGRR